ncbi:MAG: enoyl-CoA hydratase-related protein [Pseudomonadota bacterium]
MSSEPQLEPQASAVRTRQEAGVFRIHIDRAEKHNALRTADLNALARCLAVVAQDEDIRLVVLSSAGNRTFCAGADLSDVDAATLPADLFQQVTNELANLPMPTLAVIQGNVIGGGVDLALACDFRLGVLPCRLQIPAVQFGLCYPPDGIARITHRLGRRAAQRLLVLGEPLADDALATSEFFDEVVEPASLEVAADRWIATFLAGAPLAQRAMKRLIVDAESHRVDATEARAWVRRCADSEDLREGLAARREKRRPRFTGR